MRLSSRMEAALSDMTKKIDEWWEGGWVWVGSWMVGKTDGK